MNQPRKVLVVPTAQISHILLDGICNVEQSAPFLRELARRSFLANKAAAEQDTTTKQICSECMVFTSVPQGEHLFFYKRASEKQGYTEKQLAGKWSCLIGGHVEGQDLEDTPLMRVVLNCVCRESFEEIAFRPSPDDVCFLGVVNSQEDQVSNVHLGFVFRTFIPSPAILANETEIATWNFIGKAEARRILFSSSDTVEPWSRIMLEWWLKNKLPRQ